MPEDNTPTLGDQLKDARAIRHVSLEDLEEQTKVRLRHLQAIEEGRYWELPPDVFAVGFVRRYAKVLGLDPEVAATMFRQERATQRRLRKKSVAFRPSATLQRPRFVLSTRLLATISVVLVVLLLFGYLWYQVRLFAAPPQLTIVSPPEDAVTMEETITVSGETSPSATLFINNEAVPLDEGGAFRQDVKLTRGVNEIEIKAVSRLNKETVKTLHILYENEEIIPVPPVDTTPRE